MEIFDFTVSHVLVVRKLSSMEPIIFSNFFIGMAMKVAEVLTALVIVPQIKPPAAAGAPCRGAAAFHHIGRYHHTKKTGQIW
jgi:hypothetical protein